MGVLADYVLKLGTDPEARAVHEKSRDSAVQAMTTAGLSGPQQDVVLGENGAEIAKAIDTELGGTQLHPAIQAAITHSFCIS